MKLIKRGAEAALYKTEYLGKPALLKERIPKKYRHPQLDERIRKQRTKQEAVLLHKSKEAGVRSPCLLKIDKKNAAIWIEYIEGKQLKEILTPKKGELLEQLGRMIARLHAAGIVHGDLTTSNVLVNKKEMVLIDFGLGFFSEKTEDRAIDLLNFKKTFQATHADFPQGFEIVLKAYATQNPKASAVFRQMEKAEERIRYA